MARNPRKARRLVVGGRVFLWTLRHRHRVGGGGRPADCRDVLALYPQQAGGGGPLRIVFAEGPGRFVSGGAPLGSGDVGRTRGDSLNLHEPGAVRALLDAASAHGYGASAGRGVAEFDGWALLEEAAAARARRPAAGSGG